MNLFKRDRSNAPTIKYATRQDFCNTFSEDVDGLFCLAHLLTGDEQQAEQCFLAGLDECLNATHVFDGWTHHWAKRSIIRHAIRCLKRENGTNGSSMSAHFGVRAATHIRPNPFIKRLLRLNHLERFVFVLCVLERYSDFECALLVDCSVPEVRNALIRAIEQISVSRAHLSTACPECKHLIAFHTKTGCAADVRRSQCTCQKQVFQSVNT